MPGSRHRPSLTGAAPRAEHGPAPRVPLPPARLPHPPGFRSRPAPAPRRRHVGAVHRRASGRIGPGRARGPAAQAAADLRPARGLGGDGRGPRPGWNPLACECRAAVGPRPAQPAGGAPCHRPPAGTPGPGGRPVALRRPAAGRGGRGRHRGPAYRPGLRSDPAGARVPGHRRQRDAPLPAAPDGAAPTARRPARAWSTLRRAGAESAGQWSSRRLRVCAARAILLEGGIRGFVPQREVRDGRRLVAQVDLGDPQRRIALEAESFAWHGDRCALSSPPSTCATLHGRSDRITSVSG